MRKLTRGNSFPMNLQFFAESTGGGEGGGAGGDPAAGGANPPASGGQQGAAIDYSKIQQMLDGALAANEDAALKAYFKEQGLSQQEAEQAMAAFKQQKAANQPDVAAMQSQLEQAQAAARQAQIQSAAAMVAVSLGLDAKTIPYVLKMADLGKAADKDGKINEETIKTELNKVLEAVPALKPQPAGSSGFVKIGAADPGQQGQGSSKAFTLKDAVSSALKK